MSESPVSVEIKPDEPGYVSWRGELLAELALARVPELIVHKRPEHSDPKSEYDFLISAQDGVCFFVQVKAFSSVRHAIQDVASVPELSWLMRADTVRQARRSQTPVILFVFDADSEHGRFARLDLLPDPKKLSLYLVRLPTENSITPDNLRRFISELRPALPA